MSDSVLIVGGGIGGIRAALDLAEAGAKVVIVDKAPVIGGRMAFLDKTFPTLDCSICIEGPLIGKVIRHPNIEVFTLAKVIGVRGEPGNFNVTIYQEPRYVTDDCTKCGKCEEVCPVSVLSEYDGGKGISLRKAIYIPYPQAEPGIYTVDIDACLNTPPGYFPCDRCVRVCERNCIDFTMGAKLIERRVGSIIVSTGYDLYDPSNIRRYGYGIIPDILTGLEFDRMLNASGPSGGELLRPSDHKHVKKILFISCVGSRDLHHLEYCSGFCCMYTLKHAIQAKQHGVEKITCLFMDLRAYGKGFEEFYIRAKREGVNIVIGRPSEIKYVNGGIKVRYEDIDKGMVLDEDYDMVVLAPAIIPSSGNRELAEALGLELDEYGFIKRGFDGMPISTSRKGIYVCGSASGPKDISDTVQEASAAAIKALSHLNKLSPSVEKFEASIVGTEEPRIGVFICHCGSNIAGVVNIDEVLKKVREVPGVEYAEDLKFACSASSVEYIAKIIREKKLNRLVVSACSPATHLDVFRTAAKIAGLNPYLVEMGNIRNLDSWVHSKEPDRATEKAIDYTLAAIERSKKLTSLEPIRIEVVRRILVIGGGLAGLYASAAAAEAGIETILVEKDGELGGFIRNLYKVAPSGISAEKLLEDAIDLVKRSGVKIYLNTEVESVDGYAGRFNVRLSNGVDLEVGAIILATGISPYTPKELLSNGKILTNLDLERSKYNIAGKNVVFIACVGSRGNGRGCSRYCCASMLHQALELRRRGKNVVIIYKDIRTYTKEGEKLYREALREGVLFLRVNADNPVEDSVDIQDGGVRVKDRLLGEVVEVPTDKIVLVLGLRPNMGVKQIADKLKLSFDREGFLMESHPKLGPADSMVPGVFLAGSVQGPKMIEETISHALAAASRAVALLSKGFIEREPIVAEIIQEKCIKCGACMRACTYGAIKGEVRKYIYVVPALCEGCGNCLGECPVEAIRMPGYNDDDIFRMMEVMLREEPIKKPIAFTCYWCSYAAADNAGIFKLQYPSSPRLIRLPCSSRVNWRLVKKAFLLGAPAVAITGCRITEDGSDCHYQRANKNTLKRYKSMIRIIEKQGIRGERLILSLFGAPEVDKFIETMRRLDEVAKSVTPEELKSTIEKLSKVK